MKTAIILSGVSGSGKSTYAQFLESLNPAGTVICTADDYFVSNGQYNFDATKLKDAHNYCQTKFRAACQAGCEVVVCANTNVRTGDRSLYIKIAEDNGYQVFSVGMENIHNMGSIHEVPEETIIRQRIQLKNSFVF